MVRGPSAMAQGVTEIVALEFLHPVIADPGTSFECVPHRHHDNHVLHGIISTDFAKQLVTPQASVVHAVRGEVMQKKDPVQQLMLGVPMIGSISRTSMQHRRHSSRLLQEFANQLEDIRLRSLCIVKSWRIYQDDLLFPDMHSCLLDPDSFGC